MAYSYVTAVLKFYRNLNLQETTNAYSGVSILRFGFSIVYF